MGPGDRIGRYVVEALLGEGGMGRVYRAYDATLRRRVAIKLLRPELLKDDSGAPAHSVDRILREARMAASLDHHNVVSIFDVGEHEGVPFIVMELVKGRPLRAVVGSGEVATLERMGWLTDAARALAAAHKAGLVHRDVKPENILVRDDGVVKVLDFGIARLDRTPSLRPPPASGDANAVATAETVESLAATLDRSTVAGTPAYMAPEQIRHEHVDARADQFGWGVLAYELLSDALPWTSARGNLALLIGILEKDPPPLDAEKLGVPEVFVAAVRKALSKKPADRFASMEDLLTAIGAPLNVTTASISGPFRSMPPQDLASGPTLSATASARSLGSTAALAVTRSRQRRTRWIAVGGLVATALVAAFAMSARRQKDLLPLAAVPPAPASAATPAFQPHDARRLTFDQGCEEYPTLTPDGRSVAFDASIGDDTQIVVLDLASGAQRRMTTEPGWHFAPAISPDGSTIAYIRQRGDDVGTWLVPFDGSAPAHKLVDGRMRPSWSPDGHAIWAGPADAPRRIELATGTSTRTLRPPDGYFLVRIRELADGRVVARLLERETKLGRGLVLYGAADGPPATLFADDTEDALGLFPDNGSLLVPKLLANGRVELWRVPLDGASPALLPGNAVLPRKGLDLSHDGRQVIWSTCSTEQDLAVVRGTPLVAAQLLPKTEWTDEQPAGIPGSSSRVVVVSDRSGKRQLWVLDVEGKEKDAAKRLPAGDLEAAAPTVSPDGRFVAFTAIGKGIHVVSLDGSVEVRRLTSGAEDTSATFSSDGTMVYFATQSAAGKRAVARIPFDGSRPAETLVENADRPAASPVDERLAYVALVGEAGTPMLLDLRTTRSRPLSPALHLGSYGALRFSPDGKRVLVSAGLSQLAEVDVATGAVARKFDSGDQITSTTYVGKDIVVSRVGWRGDLWSASDPWGPAAP